MTEAISAGEKTAVVILGAPHSGALLLSECLSLLGFTSTRWTVRDTDRDAGFGARGEVARLNEAVLAELGAASDRPALVVMSGQAPLAGAEQVDTLVAQRFHDAAIAALRQDFGDARRIVLDDPRVALLPGLWDSALRALGFAPRRVVMRCNPLECVEALHRGAHLARPRAMQLWLRYTLAALSLAAGWPEQVAGGEALRRGEAGAVLDLLAAMGLAAPHHAALAVPIERLLAAQQHGPLLPPEMLFRRPLISALVKDTYRLLLDWDERDEAARREAAGGLAARFAEYCLIASAFVSQPSPVAAAATLPAAPAEPSSRRCVIIHYHLFKNAGTSIDTILKRNFGSRWLSQEYSPQPARQMAEAVGRLLLERGDLAALSSHTLALHPPEVPGIEIFPIVFLRHPLDRLKSAYLFEREQRADTPGARLAKETDFAGYLTARLADPRERFCRNAQTFRLALAGRAGGGSELEQALRALERLPFIGLVEAFDQSVERLERLLAPRFPEFRASAAFENVSRPERSLDARLAAIRIEIGDELFTALAAANSDDLMLYDRTAERYRREAAEPSAIRELAAASA